MTRAGFENLLGEIIERAYADGCNEGGRSVATAALAAIEAAGWVVVPREPTFEMVEAGRLPYRGDSSTRVYGAPDTRIVGYTFAAMLAASPLAKEPLA